MRDVDWNIIDELYKTKNITKAAANLFITQPTLTKRLQYIEDELGAHLVNRSTKGVQFTKEGEYFARQAGIYVQFWEQTKRGIEKFKDDGYGTIRIVSCYTFSQTYMSELIKEYRIMNPRIAVDINSAKSDQLLKYLKDGQADVVFVHGNYEGDITRKLLMKNQAYLISAAPITMDDLFTQTRVDSIYGEYTRKILDRWWEERYPEQPRTSITVREVNLSWKMAREGLGYTIGFFRPEDIEERGLYSVPLFYKDGTPVERNTWIMYDENYPKSAFVKSFIEFVEDKFI